MKYIKVFPSIEEYSAYMDSSEKVLPNVSYIEETQEVKYNRLTLTSYIILDQRTTTPIISGDVNGIGIQAIRSASHRYVGKNTADGTMTICQLDDNNSNYYADGSASDLKGADGDVYMKLPRFWYKAEELETDLWRIGFSMDADDVDENWEEWEGTDLIGVYEGYVENSKVYSRSGVASTGNIKRSDGYTYATNRGTGYSLVEMRHHNMIAFLFYATYGQVKAQPILGKGGNATTLLGECDALGMKDTVAATGYQTINLWGLENWYGHKQELMRNVYANYSTFSISGVGAHTVSCPSSPTSSSIGKIHVGKFLDTLPKAFGSGYGADFTRPQLNTAAVHRGGSYNYGELIRIYSYYGPSEDPGENSGTRLIFRGVIIEEKDPVIFKSLTAIA